MSVNIHHDPNEPVRLDDEAVQEKKHKELIEPGQDQPIQIHDAIDDEAVQEQPRERCNYSVMMKKKETEESVKATQDQTDEDQPSCHSDAAVEEKGSVKVTQDQPDEDQPSCHSDAAVEESVKATQDQDQPDEAQHDLDQPNQRCTYGVINIHKKEGEEQKEEDDFDAAWFMIIVTYVTVKLAWFMIVTYEAVKLAEGDAFDAAWFMIIVIYRAVKLKAEDTCIPGTNVRRPSPKDMRDDDGRKGPNAGTYGVVLTGTTSSGEAVAVKGLWYYGYLHDKKQGLNDLVQEILLLRHLYGKVRGICTSNPSWSLYYDDNFIIVLLTTLSYPFACHRQRNGAASLPTTTTATFFGDLEKFLKAMKKQGRRIRVPVAAAMARELLIRVHTQHCMGYAHRDVREGNTVLRIDTAGNDDDEGYYQVMLGDLGGTRLATDKDPAKLIADDPIAKDIYKVAAVLKALIKISDPDQQDLWDMHDALLKYDAAAATDYRSALDQCRELVTSDLWGSALAHDDGALEPHVIYYDKKRDAVEYYPMES